MKGIRRLVIFVLAALVLSTFAPKRAAASFDTTPLIISSAIAGGVLVIGLIAILVVGNEEEEESTAPLMHRPQRVPEDAGPLRFVRNCPMNDGGRALVCW